MFKKTYKKRIIATCLMLIASLTVFGSSNIEKNSDTVSANATPITNKVVILDAGHGLPDQGGIGFTGTTEQAITLSIVFKLQRLIEQSGAKVVLTRADENGIYDIDSRSIRNKKVSDIKNRVYIGNQSGGDIYISIHLNKYSQSKYSGWQTFYQSSNENSKLLSNKIQLELNKNMDKENKRIPMAIKGIYIMDKVNIPSCIVECGFLSNKKEEQELKQNEYQNKLAWGIYSGLQQYFLERK